MKEKKRIAGYLINIAKTSNGTIEVDIDFGLCFKNSFNVLDRKVTEDCINIKYNSEIDEKPCISIKTLKGPTIEGFNLKNKHLIEIKNILKNSEYPELVKLSELL